MSEPGADWAMAREERAWREAMGAGLPDVEDEYTREQRGRLFGICAKLDFNELLVLSLIAERLAMGRRQYGPLRPLRDPHGRTWLQELGNELCDGLVYLMADNIRHAAEAYRATGVLDAGAEEDD